MCHAQHSRWSHVTVMPPTGGTLQMQFRNKGDWDYLSFLFICYLVNVTLFNYVHSVTLDMN